MSNETLVLEGKIEKLGPDAGLVSGTVAVYRLAKYRVERVCKGKYDGQEIVVDHLIFTGKEFENVKIGDRVCLTVKVSDKILARNNAEEIRQPDETVRTFYIATESIGLISDDSKCCATTP